MPVVYTIMAVSAFILIILAVVLLNSKKENTQAAKTRELLQSPTPSPTEEVVFAEGQEDIETLYKEKKLRSEDLDFWNMYQDENEPVEVIPEETPAPTPTHEPTDEELASDGKHTLVTYADGTEEWQEISEDIPLHTYDLTNIKIVNGQMEYYVDAKQNSWLGVDLSQSNGKVDFEELKASGVDFVMLKIGQRGYESGLITLDDNFVTNITEATNAGLEIGVYFFSQAVNVDEAIAEAEFVVSNLIPYKITYPVAFNMEHIANDKSRIDTLDEDKKTQIAEAFLSQIEKDGYKPILYGNKSWLLTELISEPLLVDYDVWLFDANPVPDYPYQFKLWKYAVDQQVSGVEKNTDYIISFVDYTRK